MRLHAPCRRLPAFVSRTASCVAIGLVALGAAAQSLEETHVTGAVSGSSSRGGRVDITFECRGEPTCVGGYEARHHNEGCSNVLPTAGPVRVSGLDLRRTGLVTPTFTFEGFDFDDERRADGTCVIRPGTARDAVFTVPGSWNGESGTLQATLTEENGSTVLMTGTFQARRNAPPPVFPMVVSGTITPAVASVQAQIQFRPQDVGTQGRVFVFAVAPAERVRGGLLMKDAAVAWQAPPRRKEDTPVQCVLAQLAGNGQLNAVSASALQAALSGVLSAQGASVQILDNVATPNVAGATFFVGYGASPSAMINNGVNRSAVTVPGDRMCQPQPPQTGWWWNPAEDGRGFSLEVRGNNLFFASFLYDVTGRSTWYVATGPASLDGSYFSGPLYSARGGQTLGGAYTGAPTLTEAGTLTLAFNNDRQGTLVWPGGTVPIQRFDIVSGGSRMPPAQDQPENGWWWNPQESGRGFFMEWQGNTLDLAGYMYDDQGNSVWYLAWAGMPANSMSFNGTWWSFANGQTLTGAWKPNTRVNDNVAPVTIQFTSRSTAVMTLPNGRTTQLQRHRF